MGKRFTDTFVLDMYSGPCWEQLHDGSSVNAMWLKQMSACSAMHGNKLYTLQPNLQEQLLELQVMSLTVPEDIERMKSAKKRDQEQVGQQFAEASAAGSLLWWLCLLRWLCLMRRLVARMAHSLEP